MIIFIFGEENYLSYQKLNQIKQKYLEKIGSTNLVEIEANNFDFNQLQGLLYAMPFLAKKRLAIVKNLLSSSNKTNIDKTQKIIKNIPDSTVALFFESQKFDKKLALYKTLKKEKCFEFNKLKDIDLIKWATQKLTKNKIPTKISCQIAQVLIQNSSDMFEINNNIEKISLYLIDNPYKGNEILNLIKTNKKTSIFLFLDAILEKNQKKSIYYFEKLLLQKENELYILSMIVFQLRTMFTIKDLLQNKYKNTKGNISFLVAKDTKINPFIVQKTINKINNYDFKKLYFLYNLLLEKEIAIKKGLLSPVVGIEIFLTKL